MKTTEEKMSKFDLLEKEKQRIYNVGILRGKQQTLKDVLKKIEINEALIQKQITY